MCSPILYFLPIRFSPRKAKCFLMIIISCKRVNGKSSKNYVNTCTVEPRYFEVPREMKKMFEIAGLRNNRGSVKGKGKSKGIRSSFEIVGTSN